MSLRPRQIQTAVPLKPTRDTADNRDKKGQNEGLESGSEDDAMGMVKALAEHGPVGERSEAGSQNPSGHDVLNLLTAITEQQLDRSAEVKELASPSTDAVAEKEQYREDAAEVVQTEQFLPAEDGPRENVVAKAKGGTDLDQLLAKQMIRSHFAVDRRKTR